MRIVCPVCKSRLWRDPVFPRMITCPRCGNKFRPTVSLAFFQLVLLVLVIVLLAGLAYFTGAGIWLGIAVIAAVLLIFFYFPKLINLEHVKPNLVVEGPPDEKNVEWEDEDTEDESDRDFYKISCICSLVLLLIILVYLIVHLTG
jgi:hypothetical protein